MNEGQNLFYLPPGVDFAQELVCGLKERLSGHSPEAMARVRLFLNSQRMRRRVIDVFTAGGASFLPRMDVVSELQGDPILADLPHPDPDLRRRLQLTRLVGSLLTAQPDLAPMSARFDLAESLMRLLTEMQDEAVSPAAVAELDVSNHSVHWARTQEFLKIVAPLALARGDMPSRQREAVSRLARAWKCEPPGDLVVIAGSTGSRGTTALLMETIAHLDLGAVVVPGFDNVQPNAVWREMRDAMAAEDHPQFRYRQLMERLKVAPDGFQPWRSVSPVDPERNRVISLALRPAPVTDQWRVEGPQLPDLVSACAGMSLVEAASSREEATSIALALRRAVDSGTRAALITPDRGLSRRVAAALARWGIVADDSAGKPLSLSPPGRFLRLVARGFTGPVTSDYLLTVLKHPLAGSLAARGQHLSNVRSLELHLRRYGPAFPRGQDLLDWATKQPSALPWAEALSAVVRQLGGASTAPLAEHVRRHIAVAEALARGTDVVGAGQLWREASGEATLKFMTSLREEAPHGDFMTAADYRNFFDTLIQEGEVREPGVRNPLVAFYGHREAREMVADLVILGGLTDGVWPASADPDSWLNRRMRRDAGLLLPERQIGLAAHDFQQAIAAKEVILTRALRDAEAETVPSRWLNRLCNLMEGLPERRGPLALIEMRKRGRILMESARALERPSTKHTQDPRLLPALRPSPCPPVGARPKRLSLTRITTLIRDPYAIYAQYVLGLRPLDPLRHLPEERDRGTAVHKVLEVFVKNRPPDEALLEARARLLATAEAILREETPFPSARILWLARLERAADHLLNQDTKHDGMPVLIEETGQISVGSGGFTLFGTPDRIDILPDGRLHLIDYKNGSPPTEAQQESFDKQLLFAAAMAERGGFAQLGRSEVARITFIGLGAGEKAIETEISSEKLDEQWRRFTQLIDRYGQAETGYAARRAVFETRYSRDYDHLSRFGEWQMSDRAVNIPVGQDDGA